MDFDKLGHDRAVIRGLLTQKKFVTRGGTAVSKILLDRREFIAAAGATVANSASAAGNEPTIEWRSASHRALVVRYNNLEWNIDSDRFEAGATLRTASRAREALHEIFLKGARWPGLNLDASFYCEIYQRGDSWHIRLHFAPLGSAIEFALSDWLGGKQYEADVPRDREIAIGSTMSRFVFRNSNGKISIDKDFVAQLRARDGFDVHTGRLSFQADGARIELATTSVLPNPPKGFTRFSLVEIGQIKHARRTVGLGEIGVATKRPQRVELVVDACDDAKFCAFGDPTKKGGDVQIMLRGEGVLAIQGAFSGPGATPAAKCFSSPCAQTPVEIPADRTVEIVMREGNGTMSYSHDTIVVKRGEQIRFILRNEGALTHEFMLASVKENEEHGKVMEKHPEMEHDDPNGKTLEPGKSAEVLWKFTNSGTFEFACLIPGHHQGGMHGLVIVK